ncbi:MAG: hypothetical protein WBC44_01600 [Planctomycetaceae bacterium]
MSVRLLNLPDDAKVLPHTFRVFDDMLKADASLWTAVGTVAVDADGVGGIVTLTTGALDNDEAYRSTPELFKFAADKPIQATCRLQFAEAATDDANVLFGFIDAPGADTLVDNGAGPKASFSGAIFYKVDGGTRWRVRTSVGTDYVDTETNFTAGGSSYQTLRIEVVASPDGGTIIARYFVDTAGGNAFIQASQYGAHPATPLVEHRVAIGTPTEMALCIGAKTGSAIAQAVNVDYVDSYGCR